MVSPKEKIIEELTLHPSAELAPGEVVVGLLVGLSVSGEPLVNFSQNTSNLAIPAMSTLPINAEHAGRQVALLFAQGDLTSPLIIGLIHSPLQGLIDDFQPTKSKDDVSQQDDCDTRASNFDVGPDAYVDGKRILLEGREEVVLKCGEASITLTKAGKILIRGKYILNRSSGVNRILGGSVQIN